MVKLGLKILTRTVHLCQMQSGKSLALCRFRGNLLLTPARFSLKYCKFSRRCSSVGRARGSYPRRPGFKALHRHFPTFLHPVRQNPLGFPETGRFSLEWVRQIYPLPRIDLSHPKTRPTRTQMPNRDKKITPAPVCHSKNNVRHRRPEHSLVQNLPVTPLSGVTES